MTLPEIDHLRAVVVDIEGTTTPISFVYDVLFPFAREHAGRWLEENGSSARGRAILEQFRALAAADLAEGLDAPDIPGDDGAVAVVKQWVAELMDADRKVTALKSLQGEVWKSGYASGELQGVVWPDVVDAFERWKDAGVSIWIYSSGSIAAQKLLFGSSDQGDLLEFVDGHFDTTTGPKKEASSYEAIAKEIGAEPSALLFATDNLDEARAADEAGWHVVVLNRPGNPAVEDHRFVQATTFAELP